ncbi:aspartic proteinase nepenthesin-2-like [Cryptomeria japonica]|uniref:aspartic proteinase nepenthesin-2-like n=1 Tax=Cryptomeria japonica TaxID=3369 RepID=UPI0027DA7BE1|nr:aspartic proteinase nepenthesin-2-like [Cryptomeria japonica]
MAKKLFWVLLIIALTVGMSDTAEGEPNPSDDMAQSNNARSKLRVNLRRRSAGESNFTERLRGAVLRSRRRMNMIEAFVKQRIAGRLDIETPIHLGDYEYLMTVAVGTPPVNFEASLDTGSDLIWTQCMPCKECHNQSTPIFDPSKSSTYSTIPCSNSLCGALELSKTGCNPDCTYNYGYGDASYTAGELAHESFSIGSGNNSLVTSIAFGCSHDTFGNFSQDGGLIGLGRGPLSLISQLGSKVDNKFSYCLYSITDSPSQTSPLIFGDTASLTGAKTIQFIKNSFNPSFWYIPLTGITLNGKAVKIPPGTFDVKSNGVGGMIIDSGTSLTYLTEDAYYPVREAIASAIDLTPTDGSSVELDLCYNTSGQVTLASLTFNFQGGVDYELPVDNLFIQLPGNLLCLAMNESGDALSILGNIQQQNFHILYDNAQNSLSFKPTKCDSL